MYTVEIEELPFDVRLGRHVEHDSRSKNYAFRSTTAESSPIKWSSNIPVLNQGNLGSCTGFAVAGALGYSPYYHTLSKNPNSDMGLELYKLATTLDRIRGSYPPDDTGSTVLAASKAAQKLGYVSGYQSTLSLSAFLEALQKGPLLVGTRWYKSMFNPDTNGHVQIDISSGLSGGHAYVCDEFTGTALGFKNSWGSRFGVNGRFYITLDQFGALLQNQGDATLLTPLTSPAPVPVPVPVPTPTPAVDATVLAAYRGLKIWAARNNVL